MRRKKPTRQTPTEFREALWPKFEEFGMTFGPDHGDFGPIANIHHTAAPHSEVVQSFEGPTEFVIRLLFRCSVGRSTAIGSAAPARVGPLFAIVLLAPSVVWIFRDLRVWPWDRAYYAELTLKIYDAMVHGPLAGLKALLTVPDSRAPLLPWLAQSRHATDRARWQPRARASVDQHGRRRRDAVAGLFGDAPVWR
jgi:hypothetical protein